MDDPLRYCLTLTVERHVDVTVWGNAAQSTIRPNDAKVRALDVVDGNEWLLRLASVFTRHNSPPSANGFGTLHHTHRSPVTVGRIFAPRHGRLAHTIHAGGQG